MPTGKLRINQVKQKNSAHQRNDQKFFQELALQRFDRAVDQRRAIVGRNDLDTVGQAALQNGETFLDQFNGFGGILAPAHDDDAANRFAFTIQFDDATPHLGTDAQFGNVRKQHGRAIGIDTQRDIGQIIEALYITGGANHVLGLAHLDHRSARFLITGLNRALDLGERHAKCTKFVGVDDHLVLLDHAADRGDFGHPGHRLEFILQKPVLKRAQLRKVLLTGTINQRVLKDPADSGGVGTKRRLGVIGQVWSYLA